MTFNTWKNKSR